MRSVEIIAVLGTLVGAFFTLVATLEQGLLKRIKSIPAESKDKSKELRVSGSITKWRLSRLMKSKVILKTDTGDYLFDEAAYKNLIKKRVAVIVIFLAVSITFIEII